MLRIIIMYIKIKNVANPASTLANSKYNNPNLA